MALDRMDGVYTSTLPFNFLSPNVENKDMIGSSRDGYYPCLQLEHFHDRTIMVAEPNLDVSLAAGAPEGCCNMLSIGSVNL